jgi:hypothetical protein
MSRNADELINSTVRIKMLVRDLAAAKLEGKWTGEIGLNTVYEWSIPLDEYNNDKWLIDYFTNQWKYEIPDPQLLVDLDYLKEVRLIGDDVTLFRLTSKALQLGEVKQG